MAEQRQSLHGMWSSRLAFVLAATGSAVGLGNIWRFPYVTGENGGGAFVLVYLACILLLGVPIMMAEILIGRHGRRSPINSVRILAREVGGKAAWSIIGWGGLLAALLILSFYSVIAGWTLYYVGVYVKGLFTAGSVVADSEAAFNGLLAQPWGMLGLHTLFMLMTFSVVAMGVEAGLERAVRFLMPTLFLILVLLVGYGMTTGHFVEAVGFLFQPDFSRLSWEMVTQAMGQAFFTLSLGMGAIMTYGAYLPSSASVARTSFIVAASDTFVALVAGLAIFPIVFATPGLEPGSGPGLIFVTLPAAFETMSFGAVYAVLFFVLLTVAAWTSAISLMEPVTAYLVESHDFSRRQAAFLMTAATWLLGIGSVLSFNVLSNATLFGRNILNLKDYVASNLLLPLGGFLIALFAGWVLDRRITRDQLSQIGEGSFALWRFLVRVVTPALVLIVLYMKVREL